MFPIKQMIMILFLTQTTAFAASQRETLISDLMSYKKDISSKIRLLPKPIPASQSVERASLYEIEMLLETVNEKSLSKENCNTTAANVKFEANAKATSDDQLSKPAQTVLQKIRQVCNAR